MQMIDDGNANYACLTTLNSFPACCDMCCLLLTITVANSFDLDQARH